MDHWSDVRNPPPFVLFRLPMDSEQQNRTEDSVVRGSEGAKLCGRRSSSLVLDNMTAPAHIVHITIILPTCGHPPCFWPALLQVRTNEQIFPSEIRWLCCVLYIILSTRLKRANRN